MAFKDPFQDINRVLGNAITQRLDPRNQLIQFKILEQQNELMKRQMVSDFISNAEIDVNNPSSLSNFLKDLSVLDQRFIPAFVNAQTASTKFNQQREAANIKKENFRLAEEDLLKANLEDSPGGTLLTEGEEVASVAGALGRGDVASAGIIKGMGVNEAARLKAEQDLLFEDTPTIAQQNQQLNTLIRIEKAMRGKATQEEINELATGGGAIGEFLAALYQPEKPLELPGVSLEDIQSRISELSQGLLGVGSTEKRVQGEFEQELLEVMKGLQGKDIPVLSPATKVGL